MTLLSRHSCLSEVRHYKSSVADGDVKNEHLRRTMLVREVMRIVQILEHKVNPYQNYKLSFLWRVKKI